jgi:hypothetical protein
MKVDAPFKLIIELNDDETRDLRIILESVPMKIKEELTSNELTLLDNILMEIDTYV